MRKRPAPAEEGFTLVELLVVMLLLGIVGTVTVSGLVSAFRVQTHGEQRVQATTAMQQTLAALGRDLRGADSRDSVAEAPLRVASPTQLEFDIFRDGQRIRSTYTVAAGTLTQQRRMWAENADPSGTPTANTTRPVVTDLAATAPVFEVRSFTGGCLTGCDGVTAALTNEQMRQAATVEIRLLREVGPGRPPIEVSTVIVLRNR